MSATGRYLFFLDADDMIVEESAKNLDTLLDGEAVFVIADHEQIDVTAERILGRRIKSRYVEVFREFGGGPFDPFLFSTFLFHPMIFLRSAFLEVGGFNIEYSSGEEIDMQVALVERYGRNSVGYCPSTIYRYRKNPDSVVHNHKLYVALIANIETIIGRRASGRFGQEIIAKRSGRSLLTGAAHYELVAKSDNRLCVPPWLSGEYRIVRDG